MVTKTLLLDIDGTICQYDFPKLIEKTFGLKITNGDINCYAIEDALGVPGFEVSLMFAEAAQDDPWWIPGAIETVRDFYHKGNQVYICSNRGRAMGRSFEAWLNKHDIPHDRIIEQPFYELNRLGRLCDFHIDDSPTKLANLAKFTKRRFLINQPWNERCLNIQGLFKRVESWKQLRRTLLGRRGT